MDFQATLQANIAAFQQHWPQAAILLHTFFANHQITIQSDGTHAKIRFLHNHSDAFSELVAPIQQDSSLRHCVQYELYEPSRQWLILIGASSVYSEYFQTNQLNDATPVLLIETDVAALAAYCCIRDFGALVSGKQFYGFLGPGALREYQQTLVDRLFPFFLAKPNVHFIPGVEYAQPTDEEAKRLQTIQKMVFHEREVFLKHVEAAQKRYFDQNETPIETIFFIIPSVSCWRSICDGLAEGFSQNGITAFKFYHPFPPSRAKPLDALRLTAVFYQQQPDVIITLSHASDLFIQGIESLPVKRMVWYIDQPNHLINKPHGKFDYLVPVWKEFSGALKQRSENVLEEVSIGCANINAKYRKEFDCEVGFVGSIVDTTGVKQNLPDEINQKVSAIVSDKLGDAHTDYSKLMALHELVGNDQQIIVKAANPILHTAGMTNQSLVVYYFNVECNRVRRLSVLSALHAFDLRIYGNPEWKRLLKNTPIAKCFQGDGLGTDDCMDFYRSAKINLNIHPCFAHSGPNTRDYDIPMCGGFLLSDLGLHANERLSEFYEADKEIALFDTPESAASAVRHYLNHPEKREAITKAAQERITRDHTFAARAKQMLEMLRCTRS